MRKELRGAALPGVDVPCSGQKEEAGRVRCYGAPGGVSRQCDEVKAMVARERLPRLFALTRIHDVVPVIDPIAAQ